MSVAQVGLAWLGPEDLGSELLAEARRWLTADEAERAARLAAEVDRANFVRGRWLLRRLAAAATGSAPAEWRFAIGRHGRPEPSGPAGVTAPALSLAHSRSLVVAAVSTDARVGVDVEYPDRAAPLRVAGRFFAASEAATLAVLDPDARARCFWRIWTLKEAWLKARGTGIAGSLASGTIRFADPSPPRIDSAVAPGALAEHPGPGGAMVAVCALGSQWTKVHIHRIEIPDLRR